MIEIQRMPRKSKTIPMVSLIDVVFQLLIYFMLSTSFTRTESLELSLPSTAGPATPAPVGYNDKTLNIYISDSGETYLEKESMTEGEMTDELKRLLAVNPDRGVLIYTAGKVKVQAMVHVMDRIYSAGGKNIAVADWVHGSAPVPAPVSLAPHANPAAQIKDIFAPEEGDTHG